MKGKISKELREILKYQSELFPGFSIRLGQAKTPAERRKVVDDAKRELEQTKRRLNEQARPAPTKVPGPGVSRLIPHGMYPEDVWMFALVTFSMVAFFFLMGLEIVMGK